MMTHMGMTSSSAALKLTTECMPVLVLEAVYLFDLLTISLLLDLKFVIVLLIPGPFWSTF